jgi:hypothetical protein
MIAPETRNRPWKWFLGSALFLGLSILSHYEYRWQVDTCAPLAHCAGTFTNYRLERIVYAIAAAVLAIAGVRSLWADRSR